MNGIWLVVLSQSMATSPDFDSCPLAPEASHFFLPQNFFHLFPHRHILTNSIFPARLQFLSPFRLRVLACCGCLFDFSYRLAASALSAFLPLRRRVW